MKTISFFRTITQGARVGRGRPALIFALLPALCAWAILALWSAPVVAQQAMPTAPAYDINLVTPPAGPPIARFGSSSFAENCAPCHGPEGLGNGATATSLAFSPTVFADPAVMWPLSPAELFFTTKYGRMERMMPPWQNRLDDNQIWQTVAYAWSLHTSQDEVAAGKDLYDLSCASCHGPTGAGDGPEADEGLLDLSDPVYAMANSQAAWAEKWQAAHPNVGGDWDIALQRQVLEYIRTFSITPAWESGYRPGDGVITGTVRQGTAGVALTEGLTVTLDGYVNFDQVVSLTSVVDASGAFSFTNLAVGPDFVYLATVNANDVRYSSPIVQLSAETPTATTDVVVYDTTDTAMGLRVDRAHWIVDSQPGALIVGQILAFGMDGDRTFIGSQVDGVDVPVTVGIVVPEGAEEVSFDNGELGDRFRNVGNVYYDTMPMVPGEGTNQIVVRYALPYGDTSLDVDQEFLYPVKLLNVLVAELPDLDVQMTGLEDMGPQDLQGRTYRIFSGSDIPAGSVQMGLQGLLPPGAADPREVGAATDAQGAPLAVATFEPWMMWTSLGLMALVIAGVLGWAWRSGRLQPATRRADLRDQQQELLEQIARLDDQYAAGQVGQQAWATQRAQLKSRLLDLASRQG